MCECVNDVNVIDLIWPREDRRTVEIIQKTAGEDDGSDGSGRGEAETWAT